MVNEFTLPDVVYHGTTSNHQTSLQAGINLAECYRWSDFGQGFYTTSNLFQAHKWATKRRDTYNSFQMNKTGWVKGIVLVYTVDIEKLMTLKHNIMLKQDVAWAEFIYKNRSKEKNFIHDYDFVYGPVADGKIVQLINDLDNGKIDLQEFTRFISHNFGGDQLSFHSTVSCGCLNLQRVVTVK